MNIDNFLKSIFVEGCTYEIVDGVVFGDAILDNKDVKILGVENDTFLGVRQAIIMSEKIIEIIEEGNKTPIFMPVDVAGQKLSVQDEWLSMNQYFAHLLESLEVARNHGHTLISTVYNQAIGGGFIAFGLMCDQIYALPTAKVAVMWLEGMSKITKIPQDRLEELSKTSSVFAPGIQNFKNLGGIHKVLEIGDISDNLKKDLFLSYGLDTRSQLGFDRGGRKWALPVMEQILNS